MEAAVSLSRSLHHHAHGALQIPLPASPPHHHHHSAVPLRRHSAAAAQAHAPPAARLSLAVRARSPARSSSSQALAPVPSPAPAAAHFSSRAATGYAAALADACARAGTLRPAARHARALLFRRGRHSASPDAAAAASGQLDARVGVLVRMLVAKGKAGMLDEVLAEFAAICDHLLPRARHAG